MLRMARLWAVLQLKIHKGLFLKHLALLDQAEGEGEGVEVEAVLQD